MVEEGRIEPQTAMNVLSTFDKSATEVLAAKVNVRLNFKVGERKSYASSARLIFILLKGPFGYISPL